MALPNYQGVINANPRGFGFATTEAGDGYFVTPALMKSLVPGDAVTFTLEPGKKADEQQVARILKVTREPSVWLGELEFRNGRAMLVSDEACFVGIELRGLRYVAAGQVVAVRVDKASGFGAMIRGEVLGILGPRGRPGFDFDYALAREDLKIHYDPRSLAAARDVGTVVDVAKALAGGWSDFRHLPLVTIDGESTRDFDDAVCAQEHGDHFLVHIAIADVSAYVIPGSALDEEVRQRCTSVYLPGMTVPMLPEALSTGLCSLIPGQDRLALVCVAKVDRQGILTSWTFQRALIRSQARLTYTQVHQRMCGTHLAPLGGPAVETSFEALQSLFALLQQARKVRGVLDFNDKEPRLVPRLDGQYDLAWDSRTDAHRLVEELMLLANQAAAAELTKSGAPAFFRHQKAPELADWQELGLWLAERGVFLDETPSLKAMSVALDASRDRPDFAVIGAKVRKLMQFAVYATEDSAHFSLGFGAYTHFTSPIRRYSDLQVHRLLLGETTSLTDLETAASRCSAKARNSRFAERFVWDRIKKRILARDVPLDEVMEVRVVTMSRRGAKVVFEAWQCAAFIAADSLMEGGFRWDPVALAWRGQALMELGCALSAKWLRLDEDKSKCELTAALA